jgi:hypothetical protein
MSEDDDSGSGRTSVSVRTTTKQRFDAFRRQLSAHENADMTHDDALNHLLEHFESEHEWANTDGDDS